MFNGILHPILLCRLKLFFRIGGGNVKFEIRFDFLLEHLVKNVLIRFEGQFPYLDRLGLVYYDIIDQPNL
jgi:hypothetical protein